MHVTCAARTDVGLIRSGNEDNYLMVPERGVFVVADGMGGHAAGDVASRLAADCFARAAAALPAAPLRGPDLLGALQGAVSEAHTALAAHAVLHPETSGMGATVAAAFLAPGRAHLVWLGDSRAYRIRDGRPAQLTRDHSLVNSLVARGVIPPEAARLHPDRHIITRALGIGARGPADTAETDLAPGDILLLCSDGLTDAVSSGALALAASMHDDPQDLCHALIRAANEHGGPDNITVAAAFCDA